MDMKMKAREFGFEYLRKTRSCQLTLNREGFQRFVDGVSGTATSVLGSEFTSYIQKRAASGDLVAVSLLEEDLPGDFLILKR